MKINNRPIDFVKSLCSNKNHPYKLLQQNQSLERAVRLLERFKVVITKRRKYLKNLRSVEQHEIFREMCAIFCWYR